ncbi:TetR-like C-terminal domain-containing protein [Cohnella sp. AR92]|uniref:TetR-like C-terminal domain-containing protein n=1 Tax=Cohnella sp. AR92 TaxID=648716 RepID=UPI000F8D1C58|nr:TetR-like C-terminal domain-containing protein [Cohnella sp. AR92]RUS45142.1 TetR/AcrR family transcriptional regulator [Cohnella sp. AR92]
MKRIDPRQLISKQKLHEAYLTMQLKGQEQFTIQELCDTAEVTRPTFYKLYKDTQVLRFDIHESVLAKLKAALTIKNPKPLSEMPKTEMPENLTLLFEHILAEHTAYEAFFVHQPDAIFINGVKEVMKQYVTDGIYYSQSQDRMLRVKIDLIIAYVTGAYIESIVYWIKERYETSPKEMASTLIEISLYGPYVEQPSV